MEYVDGFNPYIYCNQNPWGKWDSEGLFWDTFWDVGNIIYDVGATIYNHAVGDHKTAKSHWVDAGYDTAAAFVPFVPAGVTKIKNVGNALDKAKDVAKGTEKVADNVKNAEKTSNNVKSSKEVAEQVNKEAKSASEDSVKNAMKRGRESEKRVLEDLGEIKNTKSVSTSEGVSIPDYKNSKEIGEIKDVKKLSDSKQLRIQREVAKTEGKKHTIQTGEHTNVSKPLEKKSNIVRRKDLGPKK